MKNVLFATAALAATLYIVSPSWAAEGPTGYVDASYNHVDAKAGSSSAKADDYGVAGSITAPINDRWAFKGDLSATHLDGGSGSDDTAWSGTGHLFAKANNGWLVGGFAGGDRVSGQNAWAGGLEAQKSFDKVSLQGTVGYGKLDKVDADLWNVRGDARYFVTDNVRLDATAGWDRVKSGGVHTDAWTAGVGGEYQLATVPVSLFAAYDHAELHDFHLKSDTVTVGVRYSFGGQTLHDRNRTGGDLNSVSKLFGGLL